jgi:hypothetical protein
MVFDKLGRRREEIISIIDLAHRIESRDGFRRLIGVNYFCRLTTTILAGRRQVGHAG